MSRHEKQVMLALASVAVLAGGTQAWASPIRFDNPAGPGHFEWYGGTGSDPIGLEITSDAASQTGAFGGVTQFHQASVVPEPFVSGAGGSDVQATGPYGDMLISVALAEPIPSGYGWNDFGYIYYPGDPLYLPVGEETYLGARFDLGAGDQYGWIGVVMDAQYQLDAFAWGYETEPGVAIAAGAPEPGSLALLAMGALGVLSRRRR